MRAFCFVVGEDRDQRLKFRDITLSWKERGIDMTNKPIAADVTPDHEETHDEWFRHQVEQTLAGIKSGSVTFISEEEHTRRWAARRKELLAAAGRSE
jgi:hypothetical protein